MKAKNICWFEIKITSTHDCNVQYNLRKTGEKNFTIHSPECRLTSYVQVTLREWGPGETTSFLSWPLLSKGSELRGELGLFGIRCTREAQETLMDILWKGLFVFNISVRLAQVRFLKTNTYPMNDRLSKQHRLGLREARTGPELGPAL